MRTLTGFLSLVCVAAVAIGIAMLTYGMAWRQRITEEAVRMEAFAMAEERIARAQMWTRTVEHLYALAWVLAAVLVAFLAFFLAVIIFAHYERTRLRRFTPSANGLYPLQIANGQIVNPNLMVYPALNDNTPAAVPSAVALAASASADRVALTANLADMRMTAAGAKLLAGRYDPAPSSPPPALPQETPPPDPPQPTPTALTLADAWQQSDADRWLLGQSDAGKIYRLNLHSAVHVGLLGATGTGKTSSTALLIALLARKNGYNVVILDGKGGLDWSPYSGVFDVQPTDYTTYGDQIAAVERIHNRHMATLRLNSAPDIYSLSGLSIPPTLIVVEEAGYTAQAMRMADSANAERVASMQSNLMRVCRITGIHFLMIDQSPQNWPGGVKANIKSWLCYKLPGGQANAINLYHAHRLPPAGAFVASDDDGETVYHSWHTAPRAGAFVRRLLPAVRIIDAPCAVGAPVREPFTTPVREPFTTPVREPFTDRSQEVDPLPEPAMNGTNGDDAARWQALVDDWFASHPDALTGAPQGISDIARRMAAADGRPADWENYKSIAHKMFHDFRRSVRVNGAPLGTDRTIQEQQR